MRSFDATFAAIVGLGGLAAARQLHERRQVRAGRRAPALATTSVLPASTGRLEPIATWLPNRPRTDLGRMMAAAWAAPLTVVGASLVALAGGRATWEPEYGAYVARGVDGLSARVLGPLAMDANAIGQVIVCRHRSPSQGLLHHEAMHVRQAERLGPAIVPLYVWLGARHGYRDNPLERAARRYARAAVAVRTARP